MTAQGAADMTVAALVDAYFADPEKTKRRTNEEIERRMRKNVLPFIGEVRLDKLRRRDVRTCVDPILRRNRPVEAARVFEDVRAMIRWAIEQEFIEANPLDGMKKMGGGAPRNRVLNDEEIVTLWRGLPKSLARSKQCQAIVRLCLVTAQRVGEVAGMEKAELDLSAREWRLPGARTKNGHSHVVPLSDLAITIIKSAIEASGDSAYVFPCPVKAKLIEGRPARDAALTPIAVARTILRANGADDDRPLGRFGIAPWSAHDLRRTALTGMARLGVAPIVLGHVANHRTTTRAGVTLAVYQQYTYDKEKRGALDLWAERLGAIVERADVAEITALRA
jgi:integrase